MRISNLLAGTAVLALASFSTNAFAGDTLDAIQERGEIRCGVSTGLAGFSLPDAQGNWTGLDVDYCRALAAVIFGDADAVEFVPLTAQQRFTALQSGEVDILSRNTTWTLTRDASLGLVFAGVTFFDGQGFMVPADLGVQSALELDGAEVCVQPGTTTELNLADYFRANSMEFTGVVIESFEQSLETFFSGRCQVYTTDKSGLAAIIANDAPDPDAYVILPETISKEPLGPVIRRGDDELLAIAKWVVYGLIEAEEAGVNSGNVDEMLNSDNPTVQRLLGVSDAMGDLLGVPADWGYQMIQQVGNYGEIFDRNVGPDTPLRLERGQNDLWTRGGLMYAMPVR